MTTVRNLPLITGSQNGYVQHNQALVEIAALAFNQVKSTLSTPPASPSTHDMYIVGTSPTGAWASYPVNSLAYYNINNAWQVFTPNSGLILYHVADASVKAYNGTAWVNSGGSSGGGLTPTYRSTTYTTNYLITTADNNKDITLDFSWNKDINLIFNNITTSFNCRIKITNLRNTPYVWSVLSGGTTGGIYSINPKVRSNDVILECYYESSINKVVVISSEVIIEEKSIVNEVGTPTLSIDNSFNQLTRLSNLSAITGSFNINIDTANIKEGFVGEIVIYNPSSVYPWSVNGINGTTIIQTSNVALPSKLAAKIRVEKFFGVSGVYITVHPLAFPAKEYPRYITGSQPTPLTIDASDNGREVIANINYTSNLYIAFDDITTDFICKIQVRNIQLTPYEWSVNPSGTTQSVTLITVDDIGRDCILTCFFDSNTNGVIVVVDPIEYNYQYSFNQNIGDYPVQASDNGYINTINLAARTNDFTLQIDSAQLKQNFNSSFILTGLKDTGLRYLVAAINSSTITVTNGVASGTGDCIIEVSNPPNAANPVVTITPFGKPITPSAVSYTTGGIQFNNTHNNAIRVFEASGATANISITIAASILTNEGYESTIYIYNKPTIRTASVTATGGTINFFGSTSASSWTKLNTKLIVRRVSATDVFLEIV